MDTLSVSSSDKAGENALSVLQRDLELSSATAYETAIALGLAVRERLDGGKWLLGDMLALISPVYGDSIVADFARDVGLGRSTAYEYRAVATFYPRGAARDTLLGMANITYSHARAAMRLGDAEAALTWLAQASDDGLTVDAATAQLRAALPAARRVVIEVAHVEAYMRNGMTFVDLQTAAQVDLPSGKYKVVFTPIGGDDGYPD